MYQDLMFSLIYLGKTIKKYNKLINKLGTFGHQVIPKQDQSII